MLKYLSVYILLLLPFGVSAQQAKVIGRVLNGEREPLELATVAVKGTTVGTQTNTEGRFELQVPAQKEIVLLVRYLGYKELAQPLRLEAKEVRELQLVLEADQKQLNTVNVRGKNDADSREQVSTTKLNPRDIKHLPSAFGDFNKVLVTLPGVSSNNELSSTYSVRGGNYDENLVYVNNIEIYRPFLISAAQQEGLSFVNPDLVADITFSSGGWQPRYGDKLSSVLNIQYKQPKRFAGSVSGGLTGGTLHLEAASKNKRVSYLFGARHKNGQYLLQGLQVDGEYNPVFSDAQAYVNIDLSKGTEPVGKTTLGILASYARNNFTVAPESQVTTFGTRQTPLRLSVAFEGQELMEYTTYQTGLNLTHRFSRNYTSELILAGVLSREREFRDVEAYYRLCDVGTSGNNMGECQQERGLGSQYNHARNVLLARVASAELRNSWQLSQRSSLRFGAKMGSENISDELSEYGFTDSADYVSQTNFLNTALDLNTLRYSGFIQHTFELDSLKTITYGLRATYWDYNQELNISPRVQYSFITRHNPNLSFKAAVGLYYQPPFYRELRNFEGQLNPALQAQRAVHFVAGADYLFKSWERDFKFTAEAYYKQMTNVVPYDVDNVRLRYYARNNARAYAAGLDLRVNGEFIPGAESWLSLGLLTTKEDVQGDSIAVYNAEGELTGWQEQDYLRRPTDQLVNVGVFFQDHLPDNPTVRMYLNLVYGSGLPFGPPFRPEYRNAFDGKSYKRVDIGLSKLILLGSDLVARKNLSLESLWLGLEVLNLIDANNRVSYTYVTDVSGVTYAIPNFLTGRRLNLRFVAKF
ncbi:outer membrane receptor protein involved in Fe transport [Pontibacter ummariensis]|uniref:Outer membrane receptor proteins, mostly Fe transport n=1 Tax=Pontibacter ummariensis TaxID=1610492 RepID=A0A239BXJ5_9BACT|nr:TonB-dependent receptor [Pontibacter ummariensis]PRY15561.1 outer membrane receptor protein involved in Fe transport [Pontibacter ummariensis]SNS12636.1 Outer membrane receptor proteins, mostly Fe transport [Pontibacter ummariensis]